MRSTSTRADSTVLNKSVVRAVDSYLKDNLTGYQKMERQGSYALGTLIKPVDDQ